MKPPVSSQFTIHLSRHNDPDPKRAHTIEGQATVKQHTDGFARDEPYVETILHLGTVDLVIFADHHEEALNLAAVLSNAANVLREYGVEERAKAWMEA